MANVPAEKPLSPKDGTSPRDTAAPSEPERLMRMLGTVASGSPKVGPAVDERTPRARNGADEDVDERSGPAVGESAATPIEIESADGEAEKTGDPMVTEPAPTSPRSPRPASVASPPTSPLAKQDVAASPGPELDSAASDEERDERQREADARRAANKRKTVAFDSNVQTRTMSPRSEYTLSPRSAASGQQEDEDEDEGGSAEDDEDKGRSSFEESNAGKDDGTPEKNPQDESERPERSAVDMVPAAGINRRRQQFRSDGSTIADDESEASLFVLMRYMGCTGTPYGQIPVSTTLTFDDETTLASRQDSREFAFSFDDDATLLSQGSNLGLNGAGAGIGLRQTWTIEEDDATSPTSPTAKPVLESAESADGEGVEMGLADAVDPSVSVDASDGKELDEVLGLGESASDEKFLDEVLGTASDEKSLDEVLGTPNTEESESDRDTTPVTSPRSRFDAPTLSEDASGLSHYESASDGGSREEEDLIAFESDETEDDADVGRAFSVMEEAACLLADLGLAEDGRSESLREDDTLDEGSEVDSPYCRAETEPSDDTDKARDEPTLDAVSSEETAALLEGTSTAESHGTESLVVRKAEAALDLAALATSPKSASDSVVLASAMLSPSAAAAARARESARRAEEEVDRIALEVKADAKRRADDVDRIAEEVKAEARRRVEAEKRAAEKPEGEGDAVEETAAEPGAPDPAAGSGGGDDEDDSQGGDFLLSSRSCRRPSNAPPPDVAIDAVPAEAPGPGPEDGGPAPAAEPAGDAPEEAKCEGPAADEAHGGEDVEIGLGDFRLVVETSTSDATETGDTPTSEATGASDKENGAAAAGAAIPSACSSSTLSPTGKKVREVDALLSQTRAWLVRHGEAKGRGGPLPVGAAAGLPLGESRSLSSSSSSSGNGARPSALSLLGGADCDRPSIVTKPLSPRTLDSLLGAAKPSGGEEGGGAPKKSIMEQLADIRAKQRLLEQRQLAKAGGAEAEVAGA